jgi:hypothetical protein
MQNRAKCKLCLTTIESVSEKDYVTCQCGEISVDGGSSMRCGAKNFSNFLRVDDEGNEIIVKVKDKFDRDYLMKMLEDFIEKLECLPPNAMYSAVNHYDLLTSLNLVHMILKHKD